MDETCMGHEKKQQDSEVTRGWHHQSLHKAENRARTEERNYETSSSSLMLRTKTLMKSSPRGPAWVLHGAAEVGAAKEEGSRAGENTKG